MEQEKIEKQIGPCHLALFVEQLVEAVKDGWCVVGTDTFFMQPVATLTKMVDTAQDAPRRGRPKSQ